MIQTISEASENFCIHQIRAPYQISENVEKVRTIIAYIDIETLAGVTYRVYIASEPSFAQRISKVFLEEDESDEETLIDMSLEAVNLIVGSAKVIAEETQTNEYNISTPHFVKLDLFDVDYDEAKVITIEQDCMIIAIKELNG
jgi:chemotaxis protein CheY-P-specific phosphatase CheC